MTFLKSETKTQENWINAKASHFDEEKFVLSPGGNEREARGVTGRKFSWKATDWEMSVDLEVAEPE